MFLMLILVGASLMIYAHVHDVAPLTGLGMVLAFAGAMWGVYLLSLVARENIVPLLLACAVPIFAGYMLQLGKADVSIKIAGWVTMLIGFITAVAVLVGSISSAVETL